MNLLGLLGWWWNGSALRRRHVSASQVALFERLVPLVSIEDRIRLPIGEPYPAVLVIDRAITSDQGLKFVYVVDAQNKVEARRIATGPLQGDGLRVITDGLKPDDWVVVGFVDTPAEAHGLQQSMMAQLDIGAPGEPHIPPPDLS